MAVFDIGDTVRVYASYLTITSADAAATTGRVTPTRALTNPTAQTLTYRDPSGNEASVTQASMTSLETGCWYYDLALDEAGTWYVRVVGTGAAKGAEEMEFEVRGQRVGA